MSYRFWLFITGILGFTAVAAGALGRHALHVEGPMLRAYESGQLFHALHTLAILGVTVLMAATEGRRNAWAGWMLQIAAFAFLGGILCFSGGIYVQVSLSLQSNVNIVPTGGVLFLTGWAALALASFGFRQEKA
jgi:uncharacterized membrane protein YgdD (TMEM256/DUF423 family)